MFLRYSARYSLIKSFTALELFMRLSENTIYMNLHIFGLNCLICQNRNLRIVRR
jgi:hypothetical protein